MITDVVSGASNRWSTFPVPTSMTTTEPHCGELSAGVWLAEAGEASATAVTSSGALSQAKVRSFMRILIIGEESV